MNKLKNIGDLENLKKLGIHIEDEKTLRQELIKNEVTIKLKKDGNYYYFDWDVYKEHEEKIICWMSGGVTSAVACKLAMDLYGKENCIFVFIDTKNEHEDTYRFLNDYERILGVEIERISSDQSIEEVWEKNKSLNVAWGAVCSSTLKRQVREKWQKQVDFSYQVFGYDINETKRARNMTLNNPEVKAIYPLLLHGLSKLKCFKMLEDWGIARPKMYDLGFDNNNCYNTGCVQGGQSYWLKYAHVLP